jgi:hypothetical protein
VSSGAASDEIDSLGLELQGIAAAYGNSLLFIGYEVEGLIEIVIFPRYRFSSDDRVQGHIGNLRIAPGTPWSQILPQIDAVFSRAQSNYNRAVRVRAAESRANGSRYDAAYSHITELFRESWHGFALRLRRHGQTEREGVRFEGDPPGPVLVRSGGELYTLLVATTGSILLASGDQRSRFAE